MELVTKGKRKYGAYFELDGSKVYCAFRNPGDFFLDGKRGKFRSIGQALKDGDAAWAIDDLQLRSAKRRGCEYIAIWVRKLNWLFMTPIDTFFDPRCYYRRNYGLKGGADQRYVSTTHFAQRNREQRIGPKKMP